jgi:hypothetical protein
MAAKKAVSGGLIIILVLFLGSFLVFSQDDVSSVEDSAFTKKMRPGVPFQHEAHNEKAGIEDCAVCHHVFENGKLVEGATSEDKECSECHLSGNRDTLDLIIVYHQRCRGCHLEAKSGPILCSQCHSERTTRTSK